MNILLDGWNVFADNWQLITGMLILTALFFLPFIPRFKLTPESVSNSTSIFLALFFILSLLLRLAYVSQALLPSYFDSASHYLLIKRIMSGDLELASLRTNYYHMGFHFVAAFYASAFRVDISTVMLILGQIILAMLPIPFFFIVRRLTRSSWAGWFAVIVSAFGWGMPAHAVDWGKYPALLSLSMILFVLYLSYVLLRNKDTLSTKNKMLLYGALGMSLVGSVFVHSRVAIVFVFTLISWGVSAWWGRLTANQKRVLFFFLICIISVELIFIQKHTVLFLLLDPYIHTGIWTSALILFLSAFAYRSFSQLTFAIFFIIALLLISLFIPLADVIPGHTLLTLMDRPYVEMILFMPLSLLGCLGFANLEKMIGSLYLKYAMFGVAALILAYAIVNHNFYPSACCVIVGNDDVAAMAWMENQLPVGARIGVSSTVLRVVAADVAEGDVGADAGVWITPLIGRPAVLVPYDSAFEQQETLDQLCTKKIRYLFVGELGQSFDHEKLDSRPTWYRPLLSMAGTRVYEVSGCGG